MTNEQQELLNDYQQEIEKTKKEIEVLTKKLSFLEELSQTKTPCEEAYKNAYGKYPVKEVSENLTAEDNWNVISWDAFQKGYEQAQKDYKVGEYQEPAEGLKTLYQMLDDKYCPDACAFICNIVKEWIFQYDCDYATCKEYLEGYEECQTVLEERLK